MAYLFMGFSNFFFITLANSSCVIAFFELIAGILLVLGIASELGALLIIPVMVVAIVLVHSKNGYFIQNGGYEYALNLIILALVVLVGGPGKYTLWNFFESWR